MSDDPLLGATLGARGSGAPIGSTLAVMFSLPAPRPLQLAGCTLHLKVSPALAGALRPVTSASWSTSFQLPLDPGLAGATLALQVMFLTNGVTGLETTNAVRLRLADD